MQSWRNPEELLATRAHLPHDIAFEYIYDGGGDGAISKQVRLLKEELARGLEENRTQKELIRELTTELELLYQRSIMDGGALETEYRTRCQNYEAALKQMRVELAAARAEALKLSKMATDDRKKSIGLQAEVQRGAASYSDLCTNAENARLVALREREDLEAQVARLTTLNVKLEERATHAEGEAARAIVTHREDKLKWDQERRQLGVHAVARVHRRRRLDRMRRGLLRWRQIAEFERLRAEFAAQQCELRTTIQADHEERMLQLRTDLEEKRCCESVARQRAESSRDRLAEERPALTLAARGYGPLGVLQQWRVAMLRAREKKAVDQAAELAQGLVELEVELQRVRESFARMCVSSLIPRMHRQAMRQLFNRWALAARLLAKKDQGAELDKAWQAAEKMGGSVERIRGAACNLVFNVRTRNFMGRAFDCWRIQLEESKLSRIERFPELWRMSHIADNDGSESEEDDTDEGHTKKQKHRHSGEMGGAVARWGAFQTVTGSAERPEKRVFFKPIIPFFHAKDEGVSDGLASGRLGVSDMLRTSGALRTSVPPVDSEATGKRVIADFSPAIGLPPRVHFAETREGMARIDPVVVPTGQAISSSGPPSVEVIPPIPSPCRATSEGNEPGPTERAAAVIKKFSELRTWEAPLLEEPVGLSSRTADPSVAPNNDVALSVGSPLSGIHSPHAPSLKLNTLPVTRSEDAVSPTNKRAVSRTRSLEDSGTVSALSTTDSLGPSTQVLSRGISAPLDVSGTKTARRSSLTMATASSSLKAASGIAKRRASLTASTTAAGSVSSRSQSGSAKNVKAVRSNAALQPTGKKSEKLRAKREDIYDIYDPSEDEAGIGDVSIPDTSSEGSAPPMLVHKVLNSPSYEKWAQRIAKVD